MKTNKLYRIQAQTMTQMKKIRANIRFYSLKTHNDTHKRAKTNAKAHSQSHRKANSAALSVSLSM